MPDLYPPARADRAPLRVGVMLDGWSQPAWAAEALEGIRSSGLALVTTVILGRAPGGAPGPLAGGPALWRTYLRLDGSKHATYLEPFRPVDVRALLAEAEVLEVEPVREGEGLRLSGEDRERIRARGLDAILHLGPEGLEAGGPGLARHGTWSHRHGEAQGPRGGPDGFQEVYRRVPLTTSVLVAADGDAATARVIYRSVGATRSFESLAMNRWYAYRKSIPFALRCLRRLHEEGRLPAVPDAPVPSLAPRGAPSTAMVARLLARIARKMVQSRIRDRLGIVRDHWYLAWMAGREPRPDDPSRLRPLLPPKGRAWADPVLVERDGRRYLFIEDFDYSIRRGALSVMEIDAQGRFGEARPVLVEPYHLSYPFVFRWEGRDYMIPETQGGRSVRLYRAVEFPARWELDRVLMDGITAADPTLVEHEGRWYMFANVAESGGSTWDELFLFVAGSPLGPWRPHPMNPVRSDVRGSRPAGPLFRIDGVLHRPGQDSSLEYGASMQVHRVEELSPTRYRETVAYRVEPCLPGAVGCHTLAMDESLTVIDLKERKWSP